MDSIASGSQTTGSRDESAAADFPDKLQTLVWSSDASGERRRFGSGWRRFTGRSGSEPFDWWSDVHPDDRGGLEQTFREAFAARQPYEADYRLRRHDGEYRWLFEQASPFDGDDGVFAGYAGICVDFTLRKRAEQSLRESEQRFRRSFENPLSGMAITSPERVILEVNDSLCEMVGYERDELLGRTWHALALPEDEVWHDRMLAEVIAGERDGYVLEKRYVRKDRRTIDVIVSARAVRDDAGRVQYLVTMLQDVTASREMERVMHAIAERTSAVTGECFLQTLVRQLAQALNVRFALVGHLAEASERLAATVAISHAGGTVLNLSYPIDGTPCEQVLRRRSVYRLEGVRDRFPASHLLARMGVDYYAGAPLFDSAGKAFGVIAVLDDKPLDPPGRAEQILKVFAARAGAEIERLRADGEIKRSRALLQSIIEHLPQTLFLKDARDLRYLLLNGAGEKLLGHPREWMAGKTDHELFERGRADNFVAHDRQALADGRMIDLPEETVTTPQGERVIYTRKIPIFGESGDAEYLLGIAEDITERKRAESELLAAKAEAERADNAKSRFLAAASHDLRQPLSALTLYLGALKAKLGPEHQLLLNRMKDCAGSLSELLSNLLDLSKLDAGVVTPKCSDFSAAEVLSNLVSVHAPEALLKGLRLRCHPSLLVAHTDPVLYQQMLGNLISNAIRYTNNGGVLIGCRKHGGKYWVEVWDSGIGIPADKTQEIFEEFRQLDTARNRGSGLGLAIVAKSAALLGLATRVRSRLGRGSMFAIELPLGTQVRKVSKPHTDWRPLRIALVEDNASVRQALVFALTSVGHQVIAAPDGAAIRARLGDLRPDIVVSDYRLGAGETGFDVISSLRRTFGEELPGILITGDTEPALMRSMADRGLVVQHKPIEIETLQHCIASLCQARERTGRERAEV